MDINFVLFQYIYRYDPQNEHEACGVGFIVAIDGRRDHKVLILLFTINLIPFVDCNEMSS